MFLASCTKNYAGPGAAGAHGVIIFAEGGVRFALPSSSLVSVFQELSSFPLLSLRTIPALRAYFLPITLRGRTYALQGLITWKDILRPLETMYATPGSREVACITKTSVAQAAHLVFRQVLLSVVGQLIAPHPGPNAVTIPIQAPFITPPEQAEETSIPRIVITPPLAATSHLASLNAVPTPQDAAFGNQLTVPDPEFTVINSWRSSEDPFADTFRVDESGLDSDTPFGGFGGYPSPSWGDPEASDDTIESASWEEEDAGALGLGPTWSG